MPDQPPLPGKKDVARALLLKGTVFVHLDPRHDGVAVPAWLRGQPQLVLQVGLDMPIPIPDLRVDGNGVYGTLSFNRQAFTCSVPWDAVFAVVGDDGKGMVWPESMPPEIASEVDREARRTALRTVPPLGPEGDKVDHRPLHRVSDEDSGSHSTEAQKKSAAPQPVPALLEDDAPPPPRSLSRRPTSGEHSSASTSPSQRAPGGGRKKVKLPPYLRVVK